MDLKTWFDQAPKTKRATLIKNYAAAQNITVSTARSRANGHRGHPTDLSSVEITEDFTGGEVTRHDLHPEIFGPPAEHEASATQ